MAEELGRGDVVVLKSGGPTMTVHGKAATAGKLICVWFGDDAEVRTEAFHPDCLERRSRREPRTDDRTA